MRGLKFVVIALALTATIGGAGILTFNTSNTHGVAALAKLLSHVFQQGANTAHGTPSTTPGSGHTATPNPSNGTSPPVTPPPTATNPSPAPPTPHPTSIPTPNPTPTPTPTPQSTPTPDPTLSDGIIHLDGHGHLKLDGQPYKFTGVNAPELGTWWAVNNGCGSEVDDLDSFFASLRPNDMVRVWFNQDMGTNKYSHTVDFTGIDRVMQAAERHHQRLLIVLGNNWADCDGVQKLQPWYANDYKTIIPRDSYNNFSLTMTYRDWVSTMINRYKNSPAVGMWEPVNEAEGGWDNSANNCDQQGVWVLRSFFDDIGGLIHQLDGKHLVESGVIGTGQCGLVGDRYLIVHGSAGLDVTSYHDYGDSSPVPGGLILRLWQSSQLGKPLIVGEVGWLNDCNSMHTKQPAQFTLGADGFLPWSWAPGMSTCGF